MSDLKVKFNCPSCKNELEMELDITQNEFYCDHCNNKSSVLHVIEKLKAEDKDKPK